MKKEEILKLFENCEYDKLLENIDNIIESQSISSDLINVYEFLMKTNYLFERFDTCLNIFQRLQEKNIESISTLYYELLASIGKMDIYLALSVINKSPLLKQYIDYREVDGANYSNILKENIDVQRTLVICTFIETLGKDSLINEENRYEVGVRYYDLIGILYELGYSKAFIEEMTNNGLILF